jgi:hypothetical protein
MTTFFSAAVGVGYVNTGSTGCPNVEVGDHIPTQPPPPSANGLVYAALPAHGGRVGILGCRDPSPERRSGTHDWAHSLRDRPNSGALTKRGSAPF